MNRRTVTSMASLERRADTDRRSTMNRRIYMDRRLTATSFRDIT
ncbi:MAG: hypothetical protein V3U35_01740 [Candidatus Neomarinimicrobiota bacterium]